MIVTADDFGAAVPVNEAVERAFRQGILNTASLMVGGMAAEDAVARARSLPRLRVGLHLVLARGRPVLPAGEVPLLVDADGNFSNRLVLAGVRYAVSPAARRQLAAEIRAQFELFRATGLTLDHVNAHNHLHLHPTVLGLMLQIGRDFGLTAVRLPHEPFAFSWRAVPDDFARRLTNDLLLRPLIAYCRRRFARHGIAANDYVFGLNDSGAMDRARVLRLLAGLPDGVSELYFHPATGPWPEMEASARHYRHADELAALIDDAVASALFEHGVERTAYGALSPTCR